MIRKALELVLNILLTPSCSWSGFRPLKLDLDFIYTLIFQYSCFFPLVGLDFIIRLLKVNLYYQSIFNLGVIFNCNHSVCKTLLKFVCPSQIRGDPDGCGLNGESNGFGGTADIQRVELPAEDVLYMKKGWLMKQGLSQVSSLFLHSKHGQQFVGYLLSILKVF